MTMADNFQEDIDANVFVEFMKKVTIWDYASITRESYLALSCDEKEKLIRGYYSNMESRGSLKFIYYFSLHSFRIHSVRSYA